MVQYINKAAVVADAKDLYEDIDKCIGDLVLARSKRDQRGISDAHWKMETLMVNTQQVISYILGTLETKEVDLERELKTLDNTLFDLDGVAVAGATHYLTVDDVKDIAKHFYELGLRAKDVNEIIKTAEDHAYFAGSENTREKLINKACKWLKDNWRKHVWFDGDNIIHFGLWENDFRKAMEE